MLTAIRSFFKGYANFSGRSTRPEFWWVWLLNMVIFLPAYYSLFTGVESDKAIRNIAVFSMCIILFIIEFVPLLALIVRRLRDVGIHWAFIFIALVPLVGPIALIVMLAWPSKKDEDADTEEQDQITA